jgi:hypothetical protein|tara:strand:- start:196 stop:495 length:300 start_codon:yes stop_codon:yes gene_type:complete
VLASLADDLLEVLDEPLSCAEGGKLPACLVACLEEGEVQAVASDVVSKSLHTLLWPSLDALQELSLVLVVELLDAPLELDLCGAQRVDLLEFLQVEESL